MRCCNGIMAESGAGSIPLSDGWDRNELSEMKHLLQQAGQRIRQLDPASKVSIRDEMDKYVFLGGSCFHTTKLIVGLDYPS